MFVWEDKFEKNISAKYLEVEAEDLTERFIRGDQSRQTEGSGLGLSIAKEIIQSHNENINVISTEGVGTEFVFSLPIVENEEDSNI